VGQDFATFSADQLDEVLRLTVLIARRLARRISRRRRPVRRRGRVDLRRTLRANLTRADLIDLRFRARKRKKTKLVLLCDVSGSMDLYSRFLLQFLFAVQSVFRRVETFAFSTRLTRITDHLRARSYRQVLRRLQDVRDWSGGTRIGESLAEFNREWGRIVDRRTIVIILSDGWDTGDPEVLATEMLRIKRRAGRVIWLNPLLGNPSYEPLTRGMAAALPLVDHFAPAHNLASLRDLAQRLSLELDMGGSRNGPPSPPSVSRSCSAAMISSTVALAQMAKNGDSCSAPQSRMKRSHACSGLPPGFRA
jgi:uncharacterized protein with von Willebrand factor type A (vWA) domain